MDMVHTEQLRNLMLAIASHSSVKNLGLTKLWKLIYFIDVSALRDRGSTITGSEFVKYPFGPVPSRGEKVLKTLRREKLLETEQRASGAFNQTFVTARHKPDTRAFSDDERAIIDRVCRRLGGKTATELSSLSHAEPAWALATDLEKLDPELMSYGSSEDPEGL
jgi:uncharacterized phage-associated protein